MPPASTTNRRQPPTTESPFPPGFCDRNSLGPRITASGLVAAARGHRRSSIDGSGVPGIPCRPSSKVLSSTLSCERIEIANEAAVSRGRVALLVRRFALGTALVLLASTAESKQEHQPHRI